MAPSICVVAPPPSAVVGWRERGGGRMDGWMEEGPDARVLLRIHDATEAEATRCEEGGVAPPLPRRSDQRRKGLAVEWRGEGLEEEEEMDENAPFPFIICGSPVGLTGLGSLRGGGRRRAAILLDDDPRHGGKTRGGTTEAAFPHPFPSTPPRCKRNSNEPVLWTFGSKRNVKGIMMLAGHKKKGVRVLSGWRGRRERGRKTQRKLIQSKPESEDDERSTLPKLAYFPSSRLLDGVCPMR